MQLGMIGLGRMGANIVRRVMGKGHECVVYDRDPQAVKTLAGEGATAVNSVTELAKKLSTPRNQAMPRSICGSLRMSAAKTARSAQSRRGFALTLRSTATS